MVVAHSRERESLLKCNSPLMVDVCSSFDASIHYQHFICEKVQMFNSNSGMHHAFERSTYSLSWSYPLIQNQERLYFAACCVSRMFFVSSRMHLTTMHVRLLPSQAHVGLEPNNVRKHKDIIAGGAAPL